LDPSRKRKSTTQGGQKAKEVKVDHTMLPSLQGFTASAICPLLDSHLVNSHVGFFWDQGWSVGKLTQFHTARQSRRNRVAAKSSYTIEFMASKTTDGRQLTRAKEKHDVVLLDSSYHLEGNQLSPGSWFLFTAS
jgi:hypothetical protein